MKTTHLGIVLSGMLLIAAHSTRAAAEVKAAARTASLPWCVYDGFDGPGKGIRVVLISGDEEYRSEEALPQLGKILARHHGFTCTVLFAIDPKTGLIDPTVATNIPGLEALKSADVMIIATRFRDLPDEQMKHIADYVAAGKPIIGMRTATHAFKIAKGKTYAKWSYKSKQWDGGFGRQILGETWIAHHGRHGKQSTRGVIAPGAKTHPIVRGCDDIWGPTDVYRVRLPMPAGCRPLVFGQVLTGMKPGDGPLTGKPNDPMMPVAWTRTYQAAPGKTGKVFTTTMGAATDLASEGVRRMLVNATYWAAGLADKIDAKANVDVVGTYKPTPFGFGKFIKGVRPADHAMKQAAPGDGPDRRNVETGSVIPSISYADQPYIAVTPKGEWVCVLTTGKGREGASGQHVVASTSTDRGKTWSKLVAIESPDGPAASWACPLVTPFGRVYAFYTYNGDNVDLGRNDVHGWYAFKYSDDGGRSWSAKRYRLPLRVTACDTLKKDGKTVQMFWGICKPIVAGKTVYFSFTKLGKYFLGDGEGWLFASDNILTERDSDKIRWRMGPEGEVGIRHPEYGSVQEEHNLAALSKPGHLICVYRTTKGFPAVSYTRDGGRTWSKPEPMRYRPGGRIIRHPRACPKIWRCTNGKFLFWCHQNGGTSYHGRNPVWLCGGVEVDGAVHWSEPEILLYHTDPKKRMSYPDLVETDGRYWVTETEKEIARVHEIDPTLLAGLWGQFDARTVARRGLALSLDAAQIAKARKTGAAMPKLPALSDRGGITLEMQIKLASLDGGQIILDSRQGGKGPGLTVATTKTGTLALTVTDGKHTAAWDVDKGLLKPSTWHHVTFIVDAGPAIIMCLVDGRLCDGAPPPPPGGGGPPPPPPRGGWGGGGGGPG